MTFGVVVVRVVACASMAGLTAHIQLQFEFGQGEEGPPLPRRKRADTLPPAADPVPYRFPFRKEPSLDDVHVSDGPIGQVTVGGKNF